MWQQKVNAVFESHASKRVNGKKASDRTQEMTHDVVFASFRRLHMLGHKIQNPNNLGEKHIEILVHDWWYTQKKSQKTIQNDLSRLRVFCRWLGKPGMIGKVKKYLPDVSPNLLVVNAAATKSKSWVGNGLDMLAELARIDSRNWQLGLMLRMELAFGLRREEVLKCDPHSQDCGQYFAVLPGQGKSGRDRNIPNMSEAQRKILDFVKEKAPKNAPLGWEYMRSGEPASLKQNIVRYNNLMRALGFTKKDKGVTGHGLRAQFSENHALLNGIIPPSLGGTKCQKNKADMKTKMKQISEALGHHRIGVMAAYFCAFGKSITLDAAEKCMKNIMLGLGTLRVDELSSVTDIYREDCIHIRDIMEALDVEITLKQVQKLWQIHCHRNGVEWMKPEIEIGIAMEVASLSLLPVEEGLLI